MLSLKFTLVTSNHSWILVTPDIAKLQLQLTRIQLELSNLQYKYNSKTQNLELDFLDNVLTLSPIRQSIIPFENDIKDKKSPIIQPFYSNTHNFDRFFAKINKVFLLVSWKFVNNMCWVIFTCKYLEGNAASCAEPILTREDLELQEDWQKFFVVFREQFRDPNFQDQLTKHLYSLKQIRSIREYATDFKNLAQKVEQPHSIWRNIFYRNLKYRVKDLLVGIPCQKENYTQLKHTVLEADKH